MGAALAALNGCAQSCCGSRGRAAPDAALGDDRNQRLVQPSGALGPAHGGAQAGQPRAPVAMAEILGVADAGAADSAPRPQDVMNDFKEHTRAALQRLAAQAAARCAAGPGAGPGEAAAAAAGAQLLGADTNAAMGAAFPAGAALQLVKVLCGPPGPVLFKWRYVGKFTGVYRDAAGREVRGAGQVVDIEGACQAQVQDGQPAAVTELYYDVPALMKAMADDGAGGAGDAPCPVTGKTGFCPVLGIRAAA